MHLATHVLSRAARALATGGILASLLLGHTALIPSVASADTLTSASNTSQLDPSSTQNASTQNVPVASGVTAAPVNSAGQPVALGSAVPPEIKQWEPLILKYSAQDGVDPNLVAAIMESESQGDPNATSSVGAAGLMQVMGGSYDPETNVAQGVALLARLLQQYGSDLEKVIAAYNAGAGVVSTYNGIPPYQETQMYVFSVLNRYYLYVSG